MQNKTKIVLIVGGLVLIVTLMAVLFMTKPSSPANPSANSQSPQIKTPVADGMPQPIGEEPRQIMGTVEKISGNVVTVKQLASVDLRYEIKKEEIGSYTTLAVNDSFDEAKYQEMMKEMPGLSEDQVSPTTERTAAEMEANTKKMEELQNKVMTDPTLQAYSEETADWSKIKVGDKIAVDVNSEGKKVTIFPADFNFGFEGMEE